jgi:hypothetical protein
MMLGFSFNPRRLRAWLAYHAVELRQLGPSDRKAQALKDLAFIRKASADAHEFPAVLARKFRAAVALAELWTSDYADLMAQAAVIRADQEFARKLSAAETNKEKDEHRRTQALKEAFYKWTDEQKAAGLTHGPIIRKRKNISFDISDEESYQFTVRNDGNGETKTERTFRRWLKERPEPAPSNPDLTE